MAAAEVARGRGGESPALMELQEQDVWENDIHSPSLSTGGSNPVTVGFRQPGSDSSSESDYDEQLAKKSKQRSSYHGSEPDSVMSAAMNVSNAASSMQPQFIRRAASIPADDASAAKLGTSMPINIPMMGRANTLSSAAANVDLDVDFVPPHIIEQQKEAKLYASGQSLVGPSPSTSLKRDRLMHRNAILRRTGFLEGTAMKGSIAEVLDPIKESKESVAIDARTGDAGTRALGSPSQSASTSLPREKHSMLSQALGTSASPR
ncbi:g5493 [Coccomyxa viridis]|uniref:G5493 protein n=1 Tax=Coccomyxa viridis TaxID=1274662 RepID=A0ABP1FSZ8_9CHLO